MRRLSGQARYREDPAADHASDTDGDHHRKPDRVVAQAAHVAAGLTGGASRGRQCNGVAGFTVRCRRRFWTNATCRRSEIVRPLGFPYPSSLVVVEVSEKHERELQASSGTDFETRRYRWHEWLRVQAVRGLIWLVGLCFRAFGVPLRDACVRVLGAALHHALRKSRRVARINLDLVYGASKSDVEKNEIIRGMFRHFVRQGIDFFWTEAFYDTDRLCRVPFRGVEILHECVRRGRGVVLVLGHLGNWEVGGAVACLNGFHLAPVFKKMKSPIADFLLGRARQRYGFDLIQIQPRCFSRDAEGRRVLLPRPSILPEIGGALLKKNALVAILADQYGGATATRLKFLDQECHSFVGPVEAARRFDSPVVVSVCVYEGGQPVIYVDGPVPIYAEADEHATMVNNMERINNVFAKYIHRYPDQYAWGHRRFDRQNYEKC